MGGSQRCGECVDVCAGGSVYCASKRGDLIVLGGQAGQGLGVNLSKRAEFSGLPADALA